MNSLLFKIVVFILSQPDLRFRLFHYLGVDAVIHLSRVNKKIRTWMKKWVKNLHRFDYYELLLADCPTKDQQSVSRSILDCVCQSRQLTFSFTVEDQELLMEITSHHGKTIRHVFEMLLTPGTLINWFSLELPCYFSSSGYQNRYFLNLKFEKICYVVETTNIMNPVFILVFHSIPNPQPSFFINFLETKTFGVLKIRNYSIFVRLFH